jgi:hypothetical protein
MAPLANPVSAIAIAQPSTTAKPEGWPTISKYTSSASTPEGTKKPTVSGSQAGVKLVLDSEKLGPVGPRWEEIHVGITSGLPAGG